MKNIYYFMDVASILEKNLQESSRKIKAAKTGDSVYG